LRRFIAVWVSRVYIAGLFLFLPAMPLMMSLVFWRRDFASSYLQTLKRCLIHVKALREGPALHYFTEVAGRVPKVPAKIQGHCVQCGNCCMEHRCVFLVPMGENKFGCGIYDSHWRKFSNCGSFPLSQYDIDRYACPSYFVGKTIPIHVQ
jgi:hypothetical protein